MSSRSRVAVGAAVVALLATAGVGAGTIGAQPPGGPPHGGFEIEVLSSPPEYVSGGDARIAITSPRGVPAHTARILVNGEDVTDAFGVDGNRLEGVIDGLPLGDSVVRVEAPGQGRGRPATELTITNHPITGPMFSGPHQEPFLCASAGHRGNAELGPAIDDDCSVETVVSFKYRTTADTWADFDPDAPRPADMATTVTMDGDTVDYVVRWERGTINRFIYSLAMLSPDRHDDEPDLSAWNRRLIFAFQGGVGIGRYQGNPAVGNMLYDIGLSQGYAIAYSTANRTSTHYNLQVGGETAIMVKDRFVTTYGNPDYTVAVGGSGGAIQQYVYAQNHPGLLDAGVPQYSYPDMITQTIHVADCELLERWIDLELLVGGELKWADWNNRTWLQGLNATNDATNPAQAVMPPGYPSGSSECINGWRGLSPLALNPHFGTAPGITPEQQATTEWTHYADAVNIYGVGDDGFANRTWDNVGVQYGLQALVDGNITADEFVRLNAQAGGWKNEPEMVQEGCPILSALCALVDPTVTPPFPGIWPDQIDPWSLRNQTFDVANPAAIAPRTEADPGAIEAAYTSGLVNHGDIQIPMIDWRHYLERQLDMHNSHQSFAARQRLLNFDGDASNQVIWFTDAGPSGPEFDQTPMAFAVIDEWMRNIEANPDAGVAANKPAAAVDSCFAADGSLIHAGDDAWAGILDDASAGACTELFPVFSTSRIVAGGPITGDVFKCALQPIEDAIAAGAYGDAELTPTHLAQLTAIFPDGVCDYTQGDARRPDGL